jgi:hypothetical protein
MSWYTDFIDKAEKTMNPAPKEPKEMSDKEQTVMNIVINLLGKSSTILEYDIKTSECSLRNGNYFVTLEAGSVSVVNSKFGYDISVSLKLEIYLTYLFREEMHKRRQETKANIQKKVEHSLKSVLIDLNQQK